MSKLHDIFNEIEKEFEKVEQKSTEPLLGTGSLGNRFAYLPEEKQQEFTKKLPFLYKELQRVSKEDELEGDYYKLRSLVTTILSKQSNLLNAHLESYLIHLNNTKVSDTQGESFTVWKEKFDLITKALCVIDEYDKRVRQDDLNYSTMDKERNQLWEALDKEKQKLNHKYHNNYLNDYEALKKQYAGEVPADAEAELTKKTRELKAQVYKDTLFEKETEIENLNAKISSAAKNSDISKHKMMHDCIINTLNLFTDKPFENNPKTGLEILEQNKDGLFAKFIIDFVNFFRTIGLRDPKEVETVKKDTSWQFWKKPRNVLLSAIKAKHAEIKGDLEPELKEDETLPSTLKK